MDGDMDFSPLTERLMKEARRVFGQEQNEKYSEKFATIADKIEKLRKEIYSGENLGIDDINDKLALDDMLFSIQSKLRYDVSNILNFYELQKKFQERGTSLEKDYEDLER